MEKWTTKSLRTTRKWSAFAQEGCRWDRSAGGGGADIRDTPEVSDAQRDEWLLKTEPLQGARPRWEDDGQYWGRL